MKRMICDLLTRYRAWRDPIGTARRLGVQVGRDCRILGNALAIFGSEPYLVSVGDHVTITNGVQFVTHDGGVWVFRKEDPEIDVFGRIRVGNNVFIGVRTIILPGVTIGDNCVIGAGSVVTRDVPSETVAAGVPARVICSLTEYREKVRAKAVHMRSLPRGEKRKWLETHLK